jgi:hemolysin activation/secretion protein
MRRLLFTCALALLPGAALAQTSAPFIIDQNRGDRAQPNVQPGATGPAPLPAVNQVAVTKPFTLQAVNISGTSLPPAILGDATRAYIGKTVDSATLTDIANAVSAAYAGAGDVALYTVTIPAQDFSGGLLRLIVTEGYIEHVDLTGDTAGDMSLVTAYADKLTHEKPLRRSTLQRYLSLIRDIPGLTIDAKLLQGQPGGGVRLLLTLTKQTFHDKLSLSDAGDSILGRYQGMVDFSLYSLLRQGEETKFSFGASTIFSRYQYFGVSDSEPLDSEGTRAQLGFGYLHTQFGAIGLGGAAQTLQLAVSHPLIRGFDENLVLSGDLDGVDSHNAIFGLAPVTEKVRAFRLGASYNRSRPDWALALSANLSQGLDFADAVTPEGGGRPDFTKLVLGASFNYLISAEWVARLRAASQISFNALPATELYALGGPDFGRAFLSDTALGDSALAGSAELAWAPGWLPGPLKGSEIFTFADDGASWYRARPFPSLGLLLLPQDFHLSSAGLGLRLPLFQETKLELEAADALSTNVPGTRAGVWRFLFGLSSSL